VNQMCIDCVDIHFLNSTIQTLQFILLQRDVFLFQSNDGSTVLHLAAYQGAVSLVELLLLNGAQADIRDKDGRLPIHWATHPSSTKCINIILKVYNRYKH